MKSDKDNIILVKSFQFAIRVVNLYKQMLSMRKNLLFQNNWFVQVLQSVRMLRKAQERSQKLIFIRK